MAPPAAAPAKPPPLPAAERALSEAIRENLWFGDDDPERSASQASHSLAAAVARAAGLKPFPVVAQRVMQLLDDPDTPTVKIRRAIEQDPALAARLLRVANSALYSPAVSCRSIDDAIVRLGNRTVTEIVTSLATLGMFSDVQGLGLTFRDHCVAVAALARVLGTEWRYRGVEGAFLAGLMHDIGKLLAMQAGDIHYESFDPAALAKPDEIHIHERAVSGFDHAVLGAHVLEHWKLPGEVAQIVAWHHQPGRAFAAGGSIGTGVALLRLADTIEYQLRRSRDLDEAFVEQLAQDGAAEYAQFSREILIAMWPKFVAAREEMGRATA
ncbi:MAG TPA: HDOD domain-containing protein [Polyangiaceae bacterium]|jgi:putative nucleotidyltransferase with HDIG domain